MDAELCGWAMLGGSFQDSSRSLTGNPEGVSGAPTFPPTINTFLGGINLRYIASYLNSPPPATSGQGGPEQAICGLATLVRCGTGTTCLALAFGVSGTT